MAEKKSYSFYRSLFQNRKPGQSLADLARQNGIRPKLLYNYRSYLKRQGRLQEIESHNSQDSLPTLLPLVLRPQTKSPEPQPSHSAFQLAIEQVGTLTIPSNFEDSALQRLLSVVRSISC